MKLQNFLGTDVKYGMDAIADDRQLAFQIQVRLIDLDLLHSMADGKFDAISEVALKKFQGLMNCDEPEFLGAKTAEKLIETKPTDISKPLLQLGNDLASRILKYMQAKRYQIDIGEQEYNIIYVEGMNIDGSLNDDAPNQFNDLRIVIEVINGIPKITGRWEGTTEPGSRATHNPVISSGAIRIKFGQYKSWRVGIHGLGRASAHEALVQVTPVSVHRDFNRDFKRTGDRVDTGLFGINQHWGFDFPKNDIKSTGAGSLIGRTKTGHKEFMQLVKQDSRFLLNRRYVFVTTIIPGDEVGEIFPL